jgi:hypothetical protein
MPVSGLAMTEAASRKLALAAGGVPGLPLGAAAGAPPGCAGEVVEEGAGGGAAGMTLSVSCRISLMLPTSVSQNLLADTELMVAVELFCPPPDWLTRPPVTCVDTVAMLRASRAMFT